MTRKEDREALAARLALFKSRYLRKAQPDYDPNDRCYDREVEELMKRMDPAELDALLRGEDAEYEEGPGS